MSIYHAKLPQEMELDVCYYTRSQLKLYFTFKLTNFGENEGWAVAQNDRQNTQNSIC